MCQTQKERPGHINDITRYHTENFLILDDTAKRNLELFATTQGDPRGDALPRSRRDHDRHGGAQAARVAFLSPSRCGDDPREALRCCRDPRGAPPCARICAGPSRGSTTWSASGGASPSAWPTAGTSRPCEALFGCSRGSDSSAAIEVPRIEALRGGNRRDAGDPRSARALRRRRSAAHSPRGRDDPGGLRPGAGPDPVHIARREVVDRRARGEGTEEHGNRKPAR